MGLSRYPFITKMEESNMINTKHKDRLFCFLFGREENKRWTLSLYNAVNRSSHTDPDSIQITTMEDILYMGMKNDVSFIITDIMSIYEQQATYNPNMPVRELMYAAKLYDKYIHENKLNIYGDTLVALPIPKLVVFYNGQDNYRDRILELKDAFRAGKEKPDSKTEARAEESRKSEPYEKNKEEMEPDIAVRVRMLNINYGQNKELLDTCRPLGEYAWLIQRIREYSRHMDIEEAVDQAINELPEDFEIRSFLIGHRAEVKSMCITEYNEEETMQLFKEQGREEGREEGIGIGEQNRANEMAERMIRAKEPGDKIVLYTGLGKEDVNKLAGSLNTILVWNTVIE